MKHATVTRGGCPASAPLFLAAALCLAPAGQLASQTPDAPSEADIFGSSGADTAASSEEDIFGSFAATAESGEKAKTEYLAGGTVALRAAASSVPGEGPLTAVSDANGKLFAKLRVPDQGALYVAYTAFFPFFQGYAGSGTPPPAAEAAEVKYALSELHWSFDISKTLFVRIGNQLISWGPSRVWSPVDFINLERADSFAELDTRAGKSGLRLHLPLGHANAFAFADFSGMTADGTYGDPAETVNLAGRIDATAAGFEFGLTCYGGKHAMPRAGADFSGRLFSSTVWGEIALTSAKEPEDTALEASLGFSRALGDLKNWTVSAEGFYNSTGEDLTGYTAATIYTLPAKERAPLYQGSWYAYISLAADDLFSPSLATTLTALSNLEDRSYSLKLAEDFSFPRAVPCTLSIAWTGGGENKEFTRFAGNRALALTLSTKIDF